MLCNLHKIANSLDDHLLEVDHFGIYAKQWLHGQFSICENGNTAERLIRVSNTRPERLKYHGLVLTCLYNTMKRINYKKGKSSYFEIFPFNT